MTLPDSHQRRRLRDGQRREARHPAGDRRPRRRRPARGGGRAASTPTWPVGPHSSPRGRTCTPTTPTGSPVPAGRSRPEALVGYYGSAQEFITEGVERADRPPTSTATATTRSRSARDLLADLPLRRRRLAADDLRPGRRADTLQPFTGDLDDAARPAQRRSSRSTCRSSFTTSGAFGRFGSRAALVYAEPGSGGASLAARCCWSAAAARSTSYMRVGRRLDRRPAGRLPGAAAGPRLPRRPGDSPT